MYLYNRQDTLKIANRKIADTCAGSQISKATKVGSFKHIFLVGMRTPHTACYGKYVYCHLLGFLSNDKCISAQYEALGLAIANSCIYIYTNYRYIRYTPYK